MGRYGLNTTKYVLKWPKKHQKVPKFNYPQNVDNLPGFFLTLPLGCQAH